MNGAEAVVRCLEEEGIQVVFGYPGGAVLGLYQALRTSSIQHILPRTEQGAVHIASGYARVTGKPAVCLATSGPGATNLVTGLATAYMDSIPVVAITGQVPCGMVGTDAFQEVDITGITKPITKHNYMITDPQDIPRIIREAFHIAGTGRPGPVLVDIPRDVADAPCTATIPGTIDLPGYKPNYRGHSTQIRHACELLQNAKQPVIYAGGGVIHSGAEVELLALAEVLDAPVTVTLMGKGAFPYENGLYMGMLGMHGSPVANMAVSNCDVLLAIGCRFDDRVTMSLEKFAPHATIIHVDIDPAEIGKNVVVKVPIVGDAGLVIQDMLKLLKPCRHAEWLEQVKAWKPMQRQAYAVVDSAELTMRYVISRLFAKTGGKAIVTTDVGQHQMVCAQMYSVCRKHGFISSGGLGTMGYGIPAAVGAQLAAPEATVICVCGDGGFQMTANELATAKANGLPIKVLLFNNSTLGMVHQLQYFANDANYFGVDLSEGNPDFLKLAEAYNMAALRVTEKEQVDSALDEMLHNDRATLIECVISPEEIVYPTVLAGMGLHEMVLEAGK